MPLAINQRHEQLLHLHEPPQLQFTPHHYCKLGLICNLACFTPRIKISIPHSLTSSKRLRATIRKKRHKRQPQRYSICCCARSCWILWMMSTISWHPSKPWNTRARTWRPWRQLHVRTPTGVSKTTRKLWRIIATSSAVTSSFEITSNGSTIPCWSRTWSRSSSRSAEWRLTILRKWLGWIRSK